MTATHALPTTKRRRCRAFLADRKGATAVEFALVAAPFLFLLVAIIQTFLVFFAQQLLETAVNQSSRLILTGQAQAQSLTQSQFASKVCSNLPNFFNCNNLMIDVEVASSWTTANAGTPTLTYDSHGNVTNVWQYTPGNPGDIVVMKVMYMWPVFVGSGGTRLIMASAAFQNEAYINS
jgi:Flp pilus assembly protein TadG